MCFNCFRWRGGSHLADALVDGKQPLHGEKTASGIAKSGLRRRALLSMLAVFLAINKKAEAQFPGTEPIDLGAGPDGGRRIPEFLAAPGMLGGFFGIATFFGHTPIILYDSRFVWSQAGGLNSSVFRFVRAHEYAHHRLNHAMEKIIAFPLGNFFIDYSQELEADCWATEVLSNRNDKRAVLAGVRLYSDYLPPWDSGGRPGAEVRVRNINDCAW